MGRIAKVGVTISVLLTAIAMGTGTAVSYAQAPATSPNLTVVEKAKPKPKPAPLPTLPKGTRIAIPAVGINSLLSTYTMVHNNIYPSGSAIYWIRNLGVVPSKAEQGTVYVVAHSQRPPKKGIGNLLIDPASATITLPIGSQIIVGGRTYNVTSERTVVKTQLGAQKDLWANTPGMLVFITCMQFTTSAGYQKSGHSTTNAVIIGQLAA